MPLKCNIIVFGKLYHNVIEGYFSLTDLKNYMLDFWNNTETLDESVNVIWDFREAYFPKTSFENMEYSATDYVGSAPKLRPGRTAFLVDDSPDKHLIAYLITLVGNRFDRETKMFIDFESAKIFVGYN